MSVSTRRTLIGCVTFVSLVSVLSGCGGVGTGDAEIPVLRDNSVASRLSLVPSYASGAAAGAQPRDTGQNRNEPGSTGSPAAPTDTTANRSAPQTGSSTGSPESSPLPGNTDSGEGPPPDSGTDAAMGTRPASRRLAGLPRNNPEAADPLDHWGHRQSGGITEGLGLADPVPEVDAAYLRALRTAVQQGGRAVLPDLQEGDAVEALGARRGVTYGRWAAGPADTLSIAFDVSQAGPVLRDDAVLRATLERAGKAWSSRIADTWTTWERHAGDFKGWLINSSGSEIEVRVGEGGETSTGLEIHVVDEDLGGLADGWANTGTAPENAWEPRFGSMEIDRTFLQEADEAST